MSAVSQDDIKLEIPALGRNVSLGYLYNERTDKFLTFGIFKRNTPSTVIDRMPNPSTTIDYKLTNTYEEKFRLFKIDANIAANILCGLLAVEGSAHYLKDENQSALDVTGILKYEEHTFVEYLQTHTDECSQLYNTDLLNYQGATHIVSGIQWGGVVAVQFTDKVNKMSDIEEIAGRLKIEFEKLKGIMSVSDAAGVDIQSKDKATKSNFKLSVRGDVSLPNQVPSNYQQVQELIQAVPQLIKNTNEGKGVPLKFLLLPISALKQHLHIQCQENAFTRKIQESLLKAFVNIFDEISETEQSLTDTFDQLNNNKSCVLPLVRSKIVQLRDNFKILKTSFSTNMRETLIKVRSGEPESLLSDICNDYRKQEFSYVKVGIELGNFWAALKKVEMYQTIRREYSEIQYFGLTGDLESALLKSINDCVYILYMDSKYNETNSDVWVKTQKLFFGTLNRPFNRLFLVDCDFPFPKSTSFHKGRSVIQQVIKGITTVNDVLAEMELATKSELLTLKAVGRQAKLGELYDARTDTFLEYSLLKNNYSEIIVDSTEQNIVESYYVPTERFQDKCKALGINSEQQFSILSNMTPLTRSGKYLTLNEQPCVSLNKKKPIRSFVHTCHLTEKSVKITDSKLWENVTFESVNKGATHFVIKVEYGFTSIFSVEDLEQCDKRGNELATTIDSYLDDYYLQDKHLREYTSSLKVVFDRYNQGTSSNEQFEKLAQVNGNYATTVYSDIQGKTTKPDVLQNKEELHHFVTTKFIPSLTNSNTEGVPIGYVLYPLSNLAQEVGMLTPYVPYGTLAINKAVCLSVLADVFDSINLGKAQIGEMIAYFQDNRRVLTDKDNEILEQVKEEFKSTLESYGARLQEIIRDVKFGNATSLDLYSELVKEYQSLKFFDGNKRYVGLGKLCSIEEKIQFSKQCQENQISFLGRDSGRLELNNILTKHFDDRIYFLHYHPIWTLEFKDDWCKTLAFFLGSVNQAMADGIERKIYVADAEFGHSISRNVTRPVIHEYRNGMLSCDNVVSTKAEEDVTTQTRIEKLEEEVRTTMMEELKTQIKNLESTMGSNMKDVITKTGIIMEELTDGINALSQKMEGMDGTIGTLKEEVRTTVTEELKPQITNLENSVGLKMNDIIKNTETKMEELRVSINDLSQKTGNIEGTISTLKDEFDSKISSKLQSTSSQTNRKIDLLETYTSEVTVKILRGLIGTSLQISQLKCARKNCDALPDVCCPGATKYESFGCGGTIQLPSKGESILLDINLAPRKGASQRCLWTLDASQNNKLVNFRVKVTLLCQNPPQILDDNTLTFTEWYEYKEITTKRISIWGHKAFLSFNAKTMDSGAGFILRVDVLETSVDSSSSSSSATHTEYYGSVSYSLPSSHDFSSIVINPTRTVKMTLTVDVDSSGATNREYDSVDILEFGMDGVPKQLGRLGGRQSGISYETTNPVAALFYWWPGSSGRGVKLSWK